MVSVIIVAGGKGLRMGSDLPKQFIPIDNLPIIMRTIQVFHNYPRVSEVIVVLPKSHLDYWQTLCQEYSFDLPFKIAIGGATRFDSVKSGLGEVSDGCQYVMVHDAVRPFVTVDMLDRLMERVEECGAVVPVVESVDSVRQILDDGSSVALNRSTIKRVQTPQIFKCEIIKEAYKSDYSINFTDDASVVESLGYKIYLSDGDNANIKITNQKDLIVNKIANNASY